MRPLIEQVALLVMSSVPVLAINKGPDAAVVMLSFKIKVVPVRLIPADPVVKRVPLYVPDPLVWVRAEAVIALAVTLPASVKLVEEACPTASASTMLPPESCTVEPCRVMALVKSIAVLVVVTVPARLTFPVPVSMKAPEIEVEAPAVSVKIPA